MSNTRTTMEKTQRKELNKSVKLLRGKLIEQTEKTVKVEQELARVKNSLQTQTDKRNKQVSYPNAIRNIFCLNSSQLKAFIVGDSITKRLSPMELSSDQMKVKVKSFQVNNGVEWDMKDFLLKN